MYPITAASNYSLFQAVFFLKKKKSLLKPPQMDGFFYHLGPQHYSAISLLVSFFLFSTYSNLHHTHQAPPYPLLFSSGLRNSTLHISRGNFSYENGYSHTTHRTVFSWNTMKIISLVVLDCSPVRTLSPTSKENEDNEMTIRENHRPSFISSEHSLQE